jgi:uncharacterized membrane protein
MLKTVLFRFRNRAQFAAAATGALIGFVFLLSAVHYFVATRSLGEGDEILGSNVLIAQRQVSKFNALNLNTNTFEPEEIERLRKLPFVKQVEPIVNNRFNISLGMREEGLPYFRTDIFVQSVDDQLMDVQVDGWHWKEGDEFLPLIMPRDFMIMLNQFAASYNIPQVSEDLALTFNFRIDISGNNQKANFNARIVGFSNQISAVVVPLSFMNYGNDLYGDGNEQIVTQLMLAVEDGAFGKLEAIMDDMNLDIKKTELTIAKVKSILSAVLGVVLVISLITILMSALLIMQYSQILISKSDYEITTLLRIGYHPHTLAGTFLGYFMRTFGWLFAGALGLFLATKFFLDSFLLKAGFPVSAWPSWEAMVTLLVAVIAIVYLNYAQVRRIFVRKIYKR